MTDRISKQQILLLNSPRQGGPLRWSKDLVREINESQQYHARLETSPVRLALSHFAVSADLVHAAVPITFRFWRKPYVLTVKGDYTIEKSFWRLFYPPAIHRANAVTVPSDYLRQRVPLLRDALVIPNAVDLAQFSKVTLADREPVHCVVVTNFWFPEKARGITKLFSLLSTVKRMGGVPDFRVTVVGDGKFLPMIRQHPFVRENMVTFAGWADPRVFLHDADIFLYYSFHDNMPNAVLEAMAMGLPIVTNRVGALGEMIISNKNGCIANTDEEYVEMVKRVLQSFAFRRDLGDAARLAIEENFNWKIVIGAYLKLYESLL